MNPRLKELYQSVILQHSKNPYNFEKREDASHTVDAYNSLCGDRFQVFFELENDQIKSPSFHGYGCAISKASTSVLVKSLEGKSLDEAKAISQEYLQNLNAENTPDSSIPEEFEAFTAARDFPGRMKCATLAWEELLEYLAKQ